MDPTNAAAVIKLKGTTLRLIFDLNTFAAFEEVTEKMFLTWLDGIQKATIDAQMRRVESKQKAMHRKEMMGQGQETLEGEAAKAEETAANIEATGALMRAVSMRDFRALVWAANHTYDTQQKPRWPLSLNQIGALIDLHNFGKVMPEVLKGSLNAMPTPNEDEEKDEPVDGPFVLPSQLQREGRGGKTSLVSDADILDLMTPNSAQ